MPYRPLGPCSFRGCPARATEGGRCAIHQRPIVQRPDNRPSAAMRGYGAEWRRVRAAQLARQPHCAICGAPGHHVDHVVPLSRGGNNDEGNLQTLCHRHHSSKTARADGGFGNPKRQR